MKKNAKKMFAVMMAACMVTTAVPVTAMAEEMEVTESENMTEKESETEISENNETEVTDPVEPAENTLTLPAIAAGESNTPVEENQTENAPVDENESASEATEVYSAADINGAGDYIVAESFTATESIEITEEVNLDLNGKTITFEGTECGFKVNGGTLNITGEGTIEEPDADKGLSPIVLYGTENSSTNVTIDGDIILKGWAGIFLRQTGTADDMHVTVTDATLKGVSNGVYINGKVDGENNTIELKDVTIEGETGIYQAGMADTEIDGGSITGTQCGIIVAAGNLEIDDAAVKGGEGSGYENTGGSTGGAVEVNNTALAVIEHTTHNPASVTVKGGTFSAGAGVTAAGDVEVILEGGAFNAVDEGYGIRLTDGAEVMIDGAEINVKDGFGVYIKGDGTETTTLYMKDGEINVTGEAMAIAGNAYYDNTEVIISGGDIISADDVAVYQPQDGRMEIRGGNIMGKSGVYVKSGFVEIDGDVVIEGTAEAEFDTTNNGANGTGAAVVVETNTVGGYWDAPEIEIISGTFIGAGNAAPIQNEATAGEDVVTKFVYGGMFSASLLDSEVLADGLNTELKQPSLDAAYSYYTDEEAAKEALRNSKEGGFITTADGDAVAYHILTIDSNGGNADEVKVVKKGDMIEQPAVEKSGYRLLGWKVDDMEITFPYTVEGDVTLEAEWQKISKKKSSKKKNNEVKNEITAEKPAEDTEVNPETKPGNPAPSKPEEVKREEAIILKIGQERALVFGKEIMNDVAPVIKEGRTTLPVRLIAEALDAAVVWDGAEQKVTIEKDGLLIEIFIDQPFAMVNDAPVPLDVPGFIENGRTFLPVKFIAENLGATVLWDDTTKEVLIVPAAE